MVFYLPEMKPDTRYRLSYYLRTALPPQGKSGGANMSIGFGKKGKSILLPKRPLAGTSAWHRLVLDFTSPPETGKDSKPFVACTVSYLEGEAWFDQIELREID